jgi:hypothetical protein
MPDMASIVGFIDAAKIGAMQLLPNPQSLSAVP